MTYPKPVEGSGRKQSPVMRKLGFVTAFVRYGQTLAAFRAPCSQYPAAICGAHALSEPMLISSFP